MKYARFKNGLIIDTTTRIWSDPDSIEIQSDKIEDLLKPKDIGRNKNGYPYHFTDPCHKQEFLNLCEELLALNKNGNYILFAKKVNEKWEYVE